MLTHEQAQAQLQTFRNPNSQAEKLAKIPHLADTLKPIAWGLLGHDKTGQTLEYLNAYQTRQESAGKLNSLDSADRRKIFALLYPQIAPIIEKAWFLFPQLPYQERCFRRGFRVPNHPEIVQDKRTTWFLQLLEFCEYEQDLAWFAVWSPYLNYSAGETLGLLFAAAINENDALGAEIFSILVASAKGEQEIGAMGRHITRGLLVASRPEGWDCIETLLLAAQRQEGLRQVILETIDEAHPTAFKRILKLIVEKDLTRFTATIRAVDVWFGLGWESVNARIVKVSLEKVIAIFESVEAQKEALNSDDPETVYFALWVLGFQDAMAAIPIASQFLHHPQPEHRFVAVYFLSQVGLLESQLALIPAIEDEDLRVATRALLSLQHTHPTVWQTNFFERLETVLSRFPEQPKTLTPLLWDWMPLQSSRQFVTTALVNNIGERSPKRLISYLSRLTVYERQNVAGKLAQIPEWDEEIRNALFNLVSDASQWVRTQVLKHLSGCKITESEAIYLEKLLTRKSADLRRGILQLLLNLSDTETLASAQRLLAAKQVPQRQAGLELLRELKSHNRSISQCVHQARAYQEQKTQLTEIETQLIDTLLEIEREEATLEDALGLIDLNQLTPPVEPKVQKTYSFVTTTVSEVLQSLDDLIHEHRQTSITFKTHRGIEAELLGNCHGLSSPDPSLSLAENLANIPLREVWETWEKDRGKKYRDKDGLELVRSLAIIDASHTSPWRDHHYLETYSRTDWLQQTQKNLFVDTANFRYPTLIRSILTWFIYLNPPRNLVDFLLEACATTLTLIPFKDLNQAGNAIYLNWELQQTLYNWIQLTTYYHSLSLSAWTDEQKLRFWQFIRWSEQFTFSNPFQWCDKLNELLIAYHLGQATEDDIIDYLLGFRHKFANNQELNTLAPFATSVNHPEFRELGTLTSRKTPANLDPILKEISDRCRQRVLEVELQRGDLPTAASGAALALRSLEGIPTLLRLLQMMGKDKLIRGYTYQNLSKPAIFSHLIRVSFPAPTETPQDFAQAVKTAKIPQKQLIELAFYAPQWSNYVEHQLGWENCTEAIWWIHAHTKDNQWHVDREVRKDWAVQVSERTPLSEQSLIDGAVDVDWFLRIYSSLQGEAWQQLYEAAKYASSGAGHKRARLFSEAMVGEIDPETLIKRVTEKRNQDAVRALGLLPLAEDSQKDLLARYQIIQEYIRTSRQFGSQRQASEKLAALIAMENLSRTAGYPDPQRLEWAMEGQAIADLVEKPQTVTIAEVSVSLSITTDGKPEIKVLKQDKPLKSIPAHLKKDPEISQLQTRKQDITRQASRMRLSLEQAMNRGDNFTLSEFQQLCQHPLLAPMLAQLIFIGDQDIGYPTLKGKALQSHDGTIQPIQSETLKIAHPYDLLQTGEWHLWQKNCFENQYTQPFKQIFRELYLLTPTETANKTLSRRYENHQINPKQALALWGQRGWVACTEEGLRRTFHKANISAWVTFLDGFYTPLEMDGLTLEGVYFTRRGEWKPLPLTEIPPTIFSEVMRDIDLVVSIAHLGGIDPSASASTVESRGALIRESCRLLKFANVTVKESHALIEGHLGSYSIHLGSGVVHRQPGGALCILPVPSSHRGRLFLPFADDDPKTAEVLAKVILLARDKDIKDPSILEQIL